MFPIRWKRKPPKSMAWTQIKPLLNITFSASGKWLRQLRHTGGIAGRKLHRFYRWLGTGSLGTINFTTGTLTPEHFLSPQEFLIEFLHAGATRMLQGDAWLLKGRYGWEREREPEMQSAGWSNEKKLTQEQIRETTLSKIIPLLMSLWPTLSPGMCLKSSPGLH